MGRPAPARAGRSSVRGGGNTDRLAAGGYCRNPDPIDGRVFSGGGPVPADRAVLDWFAGLGLARAQWVHYAGVGRSGASAMAGLGPVGDRPVRRNRTYYLRR